MTDTAGTAAPGPKGGPGAPARRARTTRPQAWVGTDRYVRGRLLAVLRADPGTVSAARLEAEWDEPVQTRRCLSSLLADGLVQAAPSGYRLPG